MHAAIEQPALLFGSTIANTIAAFAGGGAGLLQLPLLLFLGQPFVIALATHKIASVALGIGASYKHLQKGSLDKSFAIFVVCVGVPGVILGSLAIIEVSDLYARAALGFMNLFLGIYSLFKRELGQSHCPKNRTTSGYIIGGAVIFFIGALNGALAAGSGLFLTMWLIIWFGLDYLRAICMTLAVCGVLFNGSGAITLAIVSEVKWSWLPTLLVGSFVGGYLGTHYAYLKGNKTIKAVFVTITIIVGLKLIQGSLL